MSWTNELTESSCFKVKHPKEVKQVIELMGLSVNLKENQIDFYSTDNEYFDDNTEVVLSLKPITIEGLEEPTNIIGIISDSCMESVDLDELEDDTYVVQSITDYLQDELIDEKQYITIMSAGFEGRMSGNYNPFGDITFITKNTVKCASLWSLENQFKEETGITD